LIGGAANTLDNPCRWTPVIYSLNGDNLQISRTYLWISDYQWRRLLNL